MRHSAKRSSASTRASRTTCPSPRRNRRRNRPTISTSARSISTTSPSLRWHVPWALPRPTTKIISEESNLPEQSEHTDTQSPATTTVTQEEAPAQKSGRKFIVIAVILLLVIGAGIFYWRSTYTESTDDAQVDGDLYQVSSRVTGQVIKVYVEDNQRIDVGQPIAEIDPKDYQVALEQAQANLASAQASAVQANVNVPITTTTTTTSISTTGSDVQAATAAVAQAQKEAQAAEARVAEAKANAIKSQLDVDRYTPLVEKDVFSKQQFDAAVATAAANKAAVLEAEATVIA